MSSRSPTLISLVSFIGIPVQVWRQSNQGLTKYLIFSEKITSSYRPVTFKMRPRSPKPCDLVRLSQRYTCASGWPSNHWHTRYLISSPELKAHRWANSIGRPLSSIAYSSQAPLGQLNRNFTWCCSHSDNEVPQVAQRNVSIFAHTRHRSPSIIEPLQNVCVCLCVCVFQFS